jgi:predicted MFS family arabinose efflux permease
MLFTVAAGNVLLQVPIGMLADRVAAEKLLMAVSLVAFAGLFLMPFLGPMGVLRWPFLFIWGGSLGGFYTLSLTLVGRRFSRDELPGANAAFVIVYEIGGMLGPMASGLGIDLWNPHGALVPLALAYALFVIGSLIARDQKRGQAPNS